jgi:hypothetical protein
MTNHFRAIEERRWNARVIARHEMSYRDGPSDEDDRPANVRAASGLSAFREHLTAPERQSPPRIDNVRSYDLGTLGGVRLTFSDAEHLAEGRVLFSASAEDPESGKVKGSVLGIIEANGDARWTHLSDEEGKPFEGKIEGLTLDSKDPRKVYFVIDDDDEDKPSRIFHAIVSEEMLSG